MGNKGYSRRDFLRNFAMMSSASLLLGLSTGCGSSDSSSNNVPGRALYGPAPVYGPGPVIPVVNGMFFLDSESKQVALNNNQDVPIHTTFKVGFGVDLSTTVPATITFTDANDNAVANTQAWEDSRALVVTPSADLLHDTKYMLIINDVTDTNGVKRNLYGAALATFKTVSA